MNKQRKMALATLAWIMTTGSLFALNGTEVIQSAHDVETGKTTHSAVQMDLISADGSVDRRLVEEWRMEENDLNKMIMVFRKPASVANTRFLQIENDDRGDDKWIYLPALKRVRRIAASDGEKSFMGTDITYDDMETRDVERDTHQLLGEETVDQWNCYKVKSMAKDPEDSQYGYRISWIDKETYVPVKVAMYDKQEELLKVLEVKKLEKVNAYWTPMDTLLTNVQTGHSTRVTFLKVVFDEPLNPRMFTTTFLERGK